MGSTVLKKLFVKSLNLETAINLVNEIQLIHDDICWDFSEMYRVRSAGMIYLVTAVEAMQRWRQKRGWRFCTDLEASYWKNTLPGISYAGNMGFFDALGIPKGSAVGTYKGSTTYCPIMRITDQNLYDDISNSAIIIQEAINAKAMKLAEVLTSDIPAAQKVVSYLIREIMRNTFEHTDMDHLWIAAQRHNSEKYIEVAIADNSVGIKQVLCVNPDLRTQITSDESALRFAVKPGVSGNAKRSKNTSYWANSGYGLYVTKELLKKVGFFVLISGNAYLYADDKKMNVIHNVKFHGTMACLRFDIDKISNIDDNIINDIVKTGEQESSSDESAVNVASKASKRFL